MQTSLPTDALLARYAVDADGSALPHYTDCFAVDFDGSVSLGDFVKAFYTTSLFRSERIVLRLLGLGSTDGDIDAMLAGRRDAFAAWTIEDRTDDQLLMCDISKRTRSWFRVEGIGKSRTRLYFGSAVIANRDALPSNYGVLLGFHRVYSRALLGTARVRLERRARR